MLKSKFYLHYMQRFLLHLLVIECLYVAKRITLMVPLLPASESLRMRMAQTSNHLPCRILIEIQPSEDAKCVRMQTTPP